MKILSHEKVYQGFNTNVYVDDVITNSGKKTRREVVERPEAVVVIPLVMSGLLWDTYLVKQHRYPLHADLWEFPAGKVDDVEQIVKTAQRELAEEISMKAAYWRVLGRWWASPGYSTELMTGFVAWGLDKCESDPNADDAGDIEVKRMRLLDAAELLHDGKSLAALYKLYALAKEESWALA